MQIFSTRAACGFLDLIGVTFVRQGNIIHLPGYSMEVVEACSGVRFIAVAHHPGSGLRLPYTAWIRSPLVAVRPFYPYCPVRQCLSPGCHGRGSLYLGSGHGREFPARDLGYACLFVSPYGIIC